MDGFPDMNDLFSSFFGGGFGFSGQGGQGQNRGEDLRYDLEVAFEEAAFGLKKEIEINRLILCEPCDGIGAEPGTKPTVCGTCGGNGQIRQTTQTIIGHFTQITTCPNCRGAGKAIETPCKNCRGEGRAKNKNNLTITIPAGVDHGTRLRVTGEGNAGPVNGIAGDLYVVVVIQPHETFKRDGYSVISSASVPYATLVLGGEIRVPVLKGEDKIKIPSGTQRGEVFTLKGHGIPNINNPDRRGDHFVQVEVEVPKKPSNEEKKLLKQLQALQQEVEPAKSNGGQSDSLFNRFKEVVSGHA